ncbi:MAG: hypothetical protein GQ574_07740 [Crocinitomix sp.]|nr:hypothetical protein [Crocinitomix sp.]
MVVRISLILFFSCFIFACEEDPKDGSFEADSSLIDESRVYEQESEINRSIDTYWVENQIDSAHMYVYNSEINKNTGQNGYSGDVEILDDSMVFHPYVFTDLTKALNYAQISNLQQRLKFNTTYEVMYGADCFNPHHGVVMWNEKHEIIGHISICIMCSTSKYFPKALGEIEMDYWEELAAELGLPWQREEIMDLIDSRPWE